MGRKVSQELRDEIVYGRDHDHARVFISSRMRTTLDTERLVTAGAVDRVSGHRAWFWERDAAVGELHSEHECVKYAKTSSGLILLVDGGLSPIVYAEYLAAREGGANRYILIRKDAKLPEDVSEFIREQQTSEVVTRNFQNADELDSLVYDALSRAIVRAMTLATIDRRERLPDGGADD
ncbi:hypothetical protein AB0N61_04285 [Microbacterium sp. NPDC089320]|uniref:hypothetical protein n=1 Tax=Microbacterium sp. NPDC089320 TaxID=3155182 RepID=UPI003420FC17